MQPAWSDWGSGMNRVRQRTALLLAALAVTAVGMVACTPRTEQPSTVPGTTAVPVPTEKQGCASSLNGKCIQPGGSSGSSGGGGFDSHHNNNRNSNGGAHGPVGGGGSGGGSGGGHGPG